jgi:hypothetical protein
MVQLTRSLGIIAISQGPTFAVNCTEYLGTRQADRSIESTEAHLEHERHPILILAYPTGYSECKASKGNASAINKTSQAKSRSEHLHTNIAIASLQAHKLIRTRATNIVSKRAFHFLLVLLLSGNLRAGISGSVAVSFITRFITGLGIDGVMIGSQRRGDDFTCSRGCVLDFLFSNFFWCSAFSFGLCDPRTRPCVDVLTRRSDSLILSCNAEALSACPSRDLRGLLSRVSVHSIVTQRNGRGIRGKTR